MKKVILTSAITMCLFSGVASAANNGEVQFLGAVTETTCDITAEVGGATLNAVQLGIAAPGQNSETPASFSLKAKDASATGCAALTESGTATVAWIGNFTKEGLAPQSGSATDARLILSTVNAKTAQSNMTSSKSSADFPANLAITDGFQYTATLKGGEEKGDFATSAAFVVSYK